MRKSFSLPLYLVILIDLLVIVALIYFVPRLISAINARRAVAPPVTAEAATVQARVVAVVEEGVVEEMGMQRPYQVVEVEGLDEPWRGARWTFDYGRTVLAAPGVSLDVGDRVMVSVHPGEDGSWRAYFVDFVRTPALIWLAGLFVVASVLLSGWKGV